MISSMKNIEQTKAFDNLISQNNIKNFKLDQINNQIKMIRDGNSKDDLIFDELKIITEFLMNNNIEFSIDQVGTILLS